MRIKSFRLCVVVLLFMIFVMGSVFPLGGGEKQPAKLKKFIDIPDGEFLRYGMYTGGEKMSDAYYVTVHETDEKGKLFYFIYQDVIPYPEGEGKLDEDYTKWPTLYVVDPEIGSVVKGIQLYNISEEAKEGLSQYGVKDIISTHYEFHQDENYVEFIMKMKADDSVVNVKEKRYKVKVKDGFPIWDGGIGIIYAVRFMDVFNGGIVYLVTPQFLKEPMPLTYKKGTRKSIDTEAGAFNVFSLDGTVMDPFLNRLFLGFFQGAAHWVEDSERMLTIYLKRTANDAQILEEISNVKMK